MIRSVLAVAAVLALAATVPPEQAASGQGAPKEVVEQKTAAKKTQAAAKAAQREARAARARHVERASQGQGGSVAPDKRE